MRSLPTFNPPPEVAIEPRTDSGRCVRHRQHTIKVLYLCWIRKTIDGASLAGNPV